MAVVGPPRACAPPVSGPTQSAVELSPVAWLPRGDLDYHVWARHGPRLGQIGRSAGWWLGDWVRYGAERYGHRYAAASRLTGYDHQTLMNMVYVATRFEISRRREKLSWSHHAEVAALDTQQQDYWLDRAATEGLTIRTLRHELSRTRGIENRHRTLPTEQPPPRALHRTSIPASLAADSESVVCPQCKHRFALHETSTGVS